MKQTNVIMYCPRCKSKIKTPKQCGSGIYECCSCQYRWLIINTSKPQGIEVNDGKSKYMLH
jgi:ribosomal protein L37AE/L43A